jgi:cyclopropane-fatty-acyl-phospholipid synthase
MNPAVIVTLLTGSFVALWLLQRRTENASWADAGWSLGIGLLSVSQLLAGSGEPMRRALAATLVLLWSVRLTAHLVQRACNGSEDGRFADLRRSWGAHAQRNFLGYFLVQVPLVLLFALPAWVLAGDGRQVGARDLAGLCIGLVGLIGTAVADRQLARHRTTATAGEVCSTGLWRYSRHPNYFFEWLFWCAWPLLAPLSPTGTLALLPVTILYLLLTRVTGIPPAERRAVLRRGDAYRKYQQATSSFFPSRPLATRKVSDMKAAIDMAERGWLPDAALRAGIRAMVSRRDRDMTRAGFDSRRHDDFADRLRQDPIALHTDAANEQHYEVPATFFEHVLGARLKYSSCYYPTADTSLDEAEAAMLGLTCERARLADGMDVLELGCGWGSLTLWMAEQYPASTITAVSNSTSQRAFIEARADARGLRNVCVITSDINQFEPPDGYDRVVSVEMFEHLRNWPLMFARVASWLRPDALVFLHVFCHREQPYLYEDKGDGDWMARYFFTGGMMPSHDLPRHIDGDLQSEAQWKVDGTHYARTANHWLANLDQRSGVLMPILAATYGEVEARRWMNRWRLFFMGCAELFGHRDGQEWWVSHHLLRRRT